MQCWTLLEAGQTGGMCAQEDPTHPIPEAERLGKTACCSFKTRTKGHTMQPLHCIVNDTS